MHGPVVAQNMGGMEIPVEPNFGGCVANMDGMTAAGSCGNQVNNADDCGFNECGMCSDYQTNGPITQSCFQYAFQDAAGACHADLIQSACAMELNADGGPDAPCLGTFQALLTLWCGP